ncbi:MAG: Cytochrome c biogenesis protein CcsA [Phycisphaerae bacterium]|nr:Cytochrome c biogenesis protein CcsA [Phycisphaerae bacterium]
MVTRRKKAAAIFSAITGTIMVMGGVYLLSGANPAEQLQSEFAQAVDLSPLAQIAVQNNGRLKSFDSYARTMMKWVSGSNKINNQSASFTYFDLLFRPNTYNDADIIFVKHIDVRRRIAQRLMNDSQVGPERMARFQKTGMIAARFLTRADVAALLEEMKQDLIRTNKAVDAIESALAVSNPAVLEANMLIIPAAGADPLAGWQPVNVLRGQTPQDQTHAEIATASVSGLDSNAQRAVTQAWGELASGWSRQDAAVVNGAIQTLAVQLPLLNPVLYPAADKLKLESWYFRNYSLVWTWIIYLLAVVPLLMAVIYHWSGARRLGLIIFSIAFLMHTSSIGIRWYLSGRIPNSNMFEAIWAATWFGSLAALVIEYLVRRSPMKNLFAIGAGVCSMVAMMCSQFMPVELNSDIDHVMPVLNDVWLYIHTNVIIFSYCLIGMAAVTAMIYLVYRVLTGDDQFARAGGAGQLILSGSGAKSFLKGPSATMGQVLDGATMVTMELSFILLWAGIVMGAIWADHSWGRPWGWDPKEVFALNTFIIFLVLVHVRLKVKDKAWWTAVLACVGCAVMLFNWIIVNFVITGLHSYA